MAELQKRSFASVLLSRSAQYVILAMVLMGIVVLQQGSTWLSSIHLHSHLEAIATLLAVIVGMMALVRYYTKKEIIYLFVGVGFMGAFFLDGYHTVVTSAYFKPYMPSNLPALAPWSWIASRQFLSCFIFLGWLLWRLNFLGHQNKNQFETVLFLTSFVGTVGMFYFFAFAPLPNAYSPTFVLGRPSELVPLLFFLIALIGYLMKGSWRDDAFEHWLVHALIISVFTQATYMAVSHRLFDLPFDMAHILKIFSYCCVLIGLLVSMFEVFQREQRSGAELAGAVRQAKENERDAIVQSLRQGVTVFDQQLNLVVCNDSFRTLMALSPEQVAVGVDIETIFNVCMEGDEEFNSHLYHIKNRHPVKYCCSLANQRVVDVVGTPVATGYVLTFVDVTELVNARRQAQSTSAKLMEILESSPMGIGISLLDSNAIRWTNSNGAKLLGFSKNRDAIGYNVDKCWVSEKHQQVFQDEFKRVGRVTAKEVQLKPINGEPIWCYLAWDKITFENQDCKLYWIYDITRQKEVQSQLMQAEKLASIGRLVVGVAHEINTPVGICITATSSLEEKTLAMIENLKKGTMSRSGLAAYLNTIIDGLTLTFHNLEQAARLVENFKQISVDRINEKPRYVNLAEYFQNIMLTLKPKLSQANVKVMIQCKVNGEFYTYPGILAQIITNLVSNSINHGFANRKNGEICIAINPAYGNNISIIFRDNGSGIARGLLNKVFEPFFTTKRLNGGTGLGLSIVHNIVVDKLGGSIVLNSERGEGIKINMVIPPTPREINDKTEQMVNDRETNVS